MYRFVFALLCVSLLGTISSGCGGGSSPSAPPSTRSAPLGQAFTLQVGQQAQIDGEDLTVSLRGVPDDSRCPEDVECFWEGDARVQVELMKAPQSGAVVELNTSPRVGPDVAEYGNYTVKLTAIAPNTKANREIKPGEYVVTLLVSKK